MTIRRLYYYKRCYKSYNQIKGAVKEGLGKVSGDSKTQAEGVVEKTVAKAKDVAEDVKGAVEGAVEGLKNSFEKEDK